MEDSSPLAAIHRPRMPEPWTKRDPFVTIPRAGASTGFGLREQMHKPGFILMKSARNASPATSLAADLSMGFSLDNSSPRFATPRRNLFPAALAVPADAGHEFLMGADLQSSSPLTMEEMMEDSPLPKSMAHHADVPDSMAATPARSDTNDDNVSNDTDTNDANDDYDEMMMDSPLPVSRKSSFDGPKFPNLERRAPRRPSITRLKGYTTSTVHCRSSKAELPYFRFGEASRLNHASSASSLSDSYESQSSHEKRPQSANSSGPGVPPHPRCRPSIQPFTGGSKSASPIYGHTRRTSNPFLRSRKSIRRSLSMFEHPEDIMKPKTDATPSPVSKPLEAVMDIEEPHEPGLPHFFNEDPGDSIPRITKETLLDVLDGKFSAQFAQKLIIDCRFEYEYDGGHIEGAVNYNDKELLSNHLFNTPMEGKTLIIFHCEYSAHRAPRMARHIRSQDRNVNAEHYPRLTYPEVYILAGGYSEFFLSHQARCYPQNYVEMDDAKHQRTCEKELGRLRARKQPILGRAKTFAFESNTTAGSSPFAKHRSLDDFSLGSPSHDASSRGRIVTL